MSGGGGREAAILHSSIRNQEGIPIEAEETQRQFDPASGFTDIQGCFQVHDGTPVLVMCVVSMDVYVGMKARG